MSEPGNGGARRFAGPRDVTTPFVKAREFLQQPGEHHDDLPPARPTVAVAVAPQVFRGVRSRRADGPRLGGSATVPRPPPPLDAGSQRAAAGAAVARAADAAPEQIKAVVAQSQKPSAVYDIIANLTNVTVEVC